jgi:hypothetical protein
MKYEQETTSRSGVHASKIDDTEPASGNPRIDKHQPKNPAECGVPDFDLGLENFICGAGSRPPLEAYQGHPAVLSVAKALLVAYRQNELTRYEDDAVAFFSDAQRILYNITSDGEGGLLYEGISSEAIHGDEILEVRRAAMRRRMRDRGLAPRPRNHDLIKHYSELMASTDDEVFLRIAASLIAAHKPEGSALAAAWKDIRNTYIPPETALTKDIAWYQMPWFVEPDAPQTDKEKAQEKDRVIKTRALAAFDQCVANVLGWRGVVMSISDALDVELSLHAIQFAKSEDKKTASIKPDPKPVDLWGKFEPPDLPHGLLPPLIEEFAFTMGDQMGADPAGIAMACLCVCGAAISDNIKVKVKRHADWYESGRIWVSVVGAPSTKKTPILNAAARPLCAIDSSMLSDWIHAVNRFNALPPEDKKGKSPPLQKRLRIEDVTIEAAQVVLEGSTEGILCLQDELSGFFGSMDKYSGGKGASADRAFWLKAYNGGQYAINRVGRGTSLLDNLSVSLLGGIQPEPIRKIASEAQDDGLLQRMLPIILKTAVMGKDVPVPDVGRRYSELIQYLNRLQPSGCCNLGILEFDDAAQAIRTGQEERHLKLMSSETVSRKLASHIGKYDGIYARLCVIWHCIKHCTVDPTDNFDAGQPLPTKIGAATAQEVADFMEQFLLPHAVAFYFGTLGLSDNHDRLCAIASYILAHQLDKISNRDVQRGDRAMRGLEDKDIRPLFEQLEAMGWLGRVPNARPSMQPIWQVNPMVHTLYADRAKKEATRRKEAKDALGILFQRED